MTVGTALPGSRTGTLLQVPALEATVPTRRRWLLVANSAVAVAVSGATWMGLNRHFPQPDLLRMSAAVVARGYMAAIAVVLDDTPAPYGYLLPRWR